jgi:hypothetical protein
VRRSPPVVPIGQTARKFMPIFGGGSLCHWLSGAAAQRTCRSEQAGSLGWQCAYLNAARVCRCAPASRPLLCRATAHLTSNAFLALSNVRSFARNGCIADPEALSNARKPDCGPGGRARGNSARRTKWPARRFKRLSALHVLVARTTRQRQSGSCACIAGGRIRIANGRASTSTT